MKFLLLVFFTSSLLSESMQYKNYDFNSTKREYLVYEPENFYKFLSLNTIENKWMWGLDFLFGYNEIKVGIYFDSIVEHMLPSKSNRIEALRLCNNFIKKKTKFNNINDLKKRYKPIKQYYKD